MLVDLLIATGDPTPVSFLVLIPIVSEMADNKKSTALFFFCWNPAFSILI